MIRFPSFYLQKKKYHSLRPWSVFIFRLLVLLSIFVPLQVLGFIKIFHKALDHFLIQSSFYIIKITNINPTIDFSVLSLRGQFWIREIKLAGFVYFFSLIILVIAFPGNEKKKLWFIPFAFALFYLFTIFKIVLIYWQFSATASSSILLFITLKLILFCGIYFLGLWWFKSQPGSLPVMSKDMMLIRIFKNFAFLFLMATAIAEPLLYYNKLLFIRDWNINASNVILEMLGYSTFQRSGGVVGIAGMPGVRATLQCLAVNVMLYFSILIAAIPSKLSYKLWYIPLGIFIINFLNILRIVALCMSQYHIPRWFDINHKVIFAYTLYGCIFLLWITWINRFSDLKTMIKNNYSRY